ncbi:VOC family protein [Aureisphaera galaxeae]|uniref:VOC family protein n=1 Tax=Aureisphaera galaxeae TaxID=1538023 RepID=UPI0023510512|nr:VOC family protein [Aureisphaera galaxeae]MDC8005254.1 VOC family protein [Aureisphaera galaxeae]
MNLNQVTVPSRDVPRAISFYQNLGLKLIVHTHDRYARFECLQGDSTFSIHYVEEMPAEGVWVYFEVENVAEKVKELSAKGIVFETEVQEQSWLWTEARLKDPDGNVLIIYKAGENRKNPPWRILDP